MERVGAGMTDAADEMRTTAGFLDVASRNGS